MSESVGFSPEAHTKSERWMREYFPELFIENAPCNDTEMYVALRFDIAVMDALGETSVFPEMMRGLETDQIDDAAIYFGLKRASELRHALE